MKNIFIVFCKVAVLALLLSGCMIQDDTGTVSINFGGSTCRVAGPNENNIDRFEFEVIFSGPGGSMSLTAKGGESIKTTLSSGRWNITVKAFVNWLDPSYAGGREFYAIGKVTADIKAGQNNAVTVPMTDEASLSIIIVRGSDVNISNAMFNQIEWYIDFEVPSFHPDVGILIGPGPHRIDHYSGYYYMMVAGNDDDDNYYYGESDLILLNPGDHKFVEIIVSERF